MLELSDIAQHPVSGLPLGSSRLVEIGRALAMAPSVLLLDEPSSGLDSAETRRLADFLSGIAAEEGITVLLIEHDVAMVLGLSSLVFVLDFGKLIAAGTATDIRANPIVQAAYFGEKIDP